MYYIKKATVELLVGSSLKNYVNWRWLIEFSRTQIILIQMIRKQFLESFLIFKTVSAAFITFLLKIITVALYQ